MKKNKTVALKTTTPEYEYDDYYWEYYYMYYDGPFYIDYELFVEVINIIVRIDDFVTVIAILANLFHLLVLTRKEMRSNFIYIIMIGICISELFMLVWSIIGSISEPLFEQDNCLTSPSLLYEYIRWFRSAFLQITKRAATWLALLMALFRMLSVVFPMNHLIGKLHTSRFGRSLVIVVILICGIWDGSYWFRYTMTNSEDDLDCFGMPINASLDRWEYSYPEEVAWIQDIYRKIDGFSHIFTSITYALVTIALVVALCRIRKRRRNISKREDDRSRSTTVLVALMATLYFTSEFVEAAQMVIRDFLWQRNRDVQYVSSHILFMAQTLITTNSTLHVFICLFVSSQYRENAKRLFICFECGKKESITQVSGATISVRRASKDKTF